MPVSAYHPIVCFGEALWNILPTGRQPGGAPVNIVYHLQRLGTNPALISRIGYDKAGKELIEALEKKHIRTDYFQMDEDKPTGTATTYTKEGYEAVHTIYNDVAWDVIQCTDELISLVSSAVFFVFGSLAARSKESGETLMNLLSSAKTKVLHIHLCAPFYNRRLIEKLVRQTDIIVLNHSELELITGWFSNYKHEADRMKALQNEFGVPAIALTDAKQGALLTMNDTCYEYTGFPIRTQETLSGEAFLAGLLVKLLDNARPEEALEYAAATAALVDSFDETLPRYSRKDIDALLPGMI